MTLILRRLLASSTFAIAGTLEGLANKLEKAAETQKSVLEPPQEVAETFESFEELEDEWEEEEDEKDRKSTRLNSSHVSISYAVFCLKKKKKKKKKKEIKNTIEE